MDIFSVSNKAEYEPLAYRMRPRTLDEFVGQDHIVGKGRLLRRAIQADQLSSLIFYGPPGTGKTALARVIANTTKSYFTTINAVLSGVKRLREEIDKAKERLSGRGQKTILFVDEVHRWNKAQQDALLPWVENGTVILIGATTENPFFEVNRALVSRSRIFQLKPLENEDLVKIANITLQDGERGYGRLHVNLDQDALKHLVHTANGDARSLLNALELAVETTPPAFPPPEGSTIHITLAIAEESIQKKAVLYDKEGDYHFDTISAFIKSLRGSDPDAALYWLAKMIHAGEDPRFIFRRMLILACEDVGLADPQAVVVVEALAATFDRVGLPEGQFHLAQAALYLSTAPKSNSALGYFDARKVVEFEQDPAVPNHLKDANRDSKSLGHGQGYLYPHSFRNHWVAQQYLPDALQGKIFYTPGKEGHEARIGEAILKRREAQLASVMEKDEAEILSYSPPDRNRQNWLKRANAKRGEMLENIQKTIFSSIIINRHDRVLDINTRSGLLIWEALRRVPEGGVWGLIDDSRSMEFLEYYASGLQQLERPVFIKSNLMDLDPAVHLKDQSTQLFDVIVGRNALLHITDIKKPLDKIYNLLDKKGRLGLAQVLPGQSPRLSGFLGSNIIKKELLNTIKQAEQQIYESAESIFAQLNAEQLEKGTKACGFKQVKVWTKVYKSRRLVTEEDISRWFNPQSKKQGYGKILNQKLNRDDFKRVLNTFKHNLSNTNLDWYSTIAFITGKK